MGKLGVNMVIQKIHLFLFSKLAGVWLKDGQGMEDQEERMKNKK